MKPDGAIKLVSELLDLPISDSDGQWCGVVDDVELDGQPGKPLRLKALLVGPGAYSGRMPRWVMWLVDRLAGNRMVRVPLDKIRNIHTIVHLDCPASELGLGESERAARRWIPHWGAM